MPGPTFVSQQEFASVDERRCSQCLPACPIERWVKVYKRVVNCNVCCTYEYVGNQIPAEFFVRRLSPVRTDFQRSRRWHNIPSLLLPDCVDQPSQLRDVEELWKSCSPAGTLMQFVLQPWQRNFLILAGWVNRQQQEVKPPTNRESDRQGATGQATNPAQR